MQHLRNIPLRTFRDYLRWKGMKKIRTTGGHEVWSRKDLLRPIVVHTHKDPVPEFIVKQALRHLGASRSDFITFLES